MKPEIRPYNPSLDAKAAHRIWIECGWIEEKETSQMDGFLSDMDVLVSEIGSEIECLVARAPGTMRFQNDDLPMGAITSVTTSHIGRQRGMAGYLTAEAIANIAKDGAAIATLGMFEQGFYNKFGFGTGSPVTVVKFDPLDLTVPRTTRPAVRLDLKDHVEIHHAMINRSLPHGGCTLGYPSIIKAELEWAEKGFGLGYRDNPDGSLSHFIYMDSKKEHGPATIVAYAYQNSEQFVELLSLIRSLGDQIRLMSIAEPPSYQLQDLLRYPLRARDVSEDSNYQAISTNTAYWQARICDVPACVSAFSRPGEEVRFNLELTDPVAKFLDDDAEWRGVAGSWVITLGNESSAETGSDDALPSMKAGVGAFTRLWLGVRPASGLAVTDDLEAPAELLAALDELVRLPVPFTGWEF